MDKGTPKERDALKAEAALASTYRDAATESPPPALDATIIAAAQRAVQPPPVHRPFARRIAAPLSVAAVIVLSVGIVLRLAHEGALEQTAPSPAPVDAQSDRAARSNETVQMPASPPRVAPAEKAVRERAETKQGTASLGDANTSGATATQSEPAAAESLARDKARIGLLAKQEARAVSRHADITAVRVHGSSGAYEFEVEIVSPDTGCQQYADWWEIVGADGRLLYRRILEHSHADEQPFARRGGPVPIDSDTIVWVRAHLSTTGYGGVAFKGSPAGGFVRAAPAPDFAAALARQPPLPKGCAF